MIFKYKNSQSQSILNSFLEPAKQKKFAHSFLKFLFRMGFSICIFENLENFSEGGKGKGNETQNNNSKLFYLLSCD